MTLAFADYLAVGFFSLVGGWLAAYLNPYLAKHGEVRAINDKLRDLVAHAEATTKATESIKMQVAGELWETQERWKAKKDLYVRLIRNLQSGAEALSGMWDVMGKRMGGTMSEEKYDAWMTVWGDQSKFARDNIRDCFALANIVSPELAKLIDVMWTEEVEAKSTDHGFVKLQADAYRKAMGAVVERGREEFGTR